MNKSIYGCVAAVVFILISLLQTPSQANPSVIIYDYTLQPEVFMPGDTGVLTLIIKNAETIATQTSGYIDGTTTISTIKNIGAEINNIYVTSDPLKGSKIHSTKNYEDVGYLAPGATIPISFKIHADQGISEGVYFPIGYIDVETYSDVRFPLPITISNATVELISSYVPFHISKNGGTRIQLTVVNHRSTPVTDVIVIPSMIADMKISPEQLCIGMMDPGIAKEIEFFIYPSEIGQKNMSFTLQFMNGNNVHFSTENISFEVIDTYEVAPIIYDAPSTIEYGGKKSIQLKIYNSKTEDITGVILTPISDVPIIPSQYFIGEMDANDIYSVSFDIDASGLTVNKTYTISFSVTFKQDGNIFETPPIMSSFTVIPNTGNGDWQALFIVVLFIFLLGSGFLLYRRRKKNHMKHLSLKQS